MRARRAGVLAFLLAGAACSLSQRDRDRCQSDGDCNPGRVCAAGICVAPGAGGTGGTGGNGTGGNGTGQGGTAGTGIAGTGTAGAGTAGTGTGGTGAPEDGGMPDRVLIGDCASDVDIDRNGIRDCAENLVVNSGFDQNIDGWSPLLTASLEWLSPGASGAANDGALAVTDEFARDSTTGIAAFQCIRLNGSTEYVVRAQAFIPDGQNPDVTGAIITNMSDVDDCSHWLAEGLNLQYAFVTPGQWLTAGGTITTSSSARSMLLYLEPVTFGVGLPFTILFDNVLVRPGR